MRANTDRPAPLPLFRPPPRPHRECEADVGRLRGTVEEGLAVTVLEGQGDTALVKEEADALRARGVLVPVRVLLRDVFFVSRAGPSWPLPPSEARK